MNLLEYSLHIQKNLNDCPPKDYAKIFVNAKQEAFHKYNNGIITSSSHGINFFKNIIQYWDNPESYCNEPKNIYEYNFVKLIQNNKENVTTNLSNQK